ncbi:hypothetical protein CTI12_AA110060 [Artemisia annua]|uniref:Uncharacterized protein n=1 Tax=Artemisia annua TaxID=35608 RepID=A0A2U1PUV1_ARTAN|nr:hypothetical protein CTI12_AA110060 [Artemisia annua]
MVKHGSKNPIQSLAKNIETSKNDIVMEKITKWLTNSQNHNIWLARSKSRVGSCGFSEGFGHLDPRVGGNALGWFHRAAITPRFRQWKDNKPKLIRLACHLVRHK